MQDKKHLYEWAEQHAVEIGKDLGTSTDDALDFLRHLIDAWEEGAPPEFFSTPGDPVGNYRVVPR